MQLPSLFRSLETTNQRLVIGARAGTTVAVHAAQLAASSVVRMRAALACWHKIIHVRTWCWTRGGYTFRHWCKY